MTLLFKELVKSLPHHFHQQSKYFFLRNTKNCKKINENFLRFHAITRFEREDPFDPCAHSRTELKTMNLKREKKKKLNLKLNSFTKKKHRKTIASYSHKKHTK
jgi:hypothetical protein